MRKNGKCHCCDEDMLMEELKIRMGAALRRGMSEIYLPVESMVLFVRMTKCTDVRVDERLIRLLVRDWTPQVCDDVVAIENQGFRWNTPEFDSKVAEKYPWWTESVWMADWHSLDAARKRAFGDMKH